jgi:hypothetical protein
MTFLNAYWRNLLFINYEVDPKILEPYLPKGTELDFYNGKCYVSMVGFMFMDVKVLGIKLYNHINFEEVNLRFYVKHNNKRGVVFIQEIVPKPLITLVANSLYHEHYTTSNMDHVWKETHDSLFFEYRWQVNNKWQSIAATTEKEADPILENSEEQFIMEHYFGYTGHKNKTFQYEVLHPSWLHYKVKDFNSAMDFEANYGTDFEHLKYAKPTSVILAKGAEVSIKNKLTVHK